MDMVGLDLVSKDSECRWDLMDILIKEDRFEGVVIMVDIRLVVMDRRPFGVEAVMVI